MRKSTEHFTHWLKQHEDYVATFQFYECDAHLSTNMILEYLERMEEILTWMSDRITKLEQKRK